MSARRVATRPATLVLATGDRVRRKNQISEQARTEGTATVLEMRPRDRVVVSLTDTTRAADQGSDWRTWRIADLVLVQSRTPQETLDA